MRTTLFIVVICVLAAGCHHTVPVVKKTADSIKKDTITTSQKIAESFPDTRMVGDTANDENAGEGYAAGRPWVDSLIADYVKHTNNKLVRFSVDHKLGETWTFDQITKTDTAIYASYEIGHDVKDKGDINSRHVADSWISIDTVKRKLYENNTGGRLTEWKR